MSDSGGRAYFSCGVFCTCRHGHIVCADGTKSEAFATVSKGMTVLEKLANEKRVSSDAVKELTRVVALSGLTREDDELDEILEGMQAEQEAWRISHSEDPQENPDIVSQFEAKERKHNAFRSKKIIH